MFLLELLKTVLLGIVEGITEWLPISSTGHMILFDEFIKLNVSEAFKEMFMVVIQLGAILAVVWLYFNKLNPFSKKKTPEKRRETWSLWGKVLVGSIPAAIVGLLLDDWLDSVFYNYQTVAVTLILYGVLFIIIERYNRSRTPAIQTLGQLNYKTALLIGVFQMLALIPGTSRSGATIVGAILIGTSRSVAAEYTFFLAIPAMLGASGLKLLKFFVKTGLGMGVQEIIILLLGMAVAFIVSVIAIKFLMRYIKKHDFTAFGYYRIVLGLLVLGYFLLVH